MNRTILFGLMVCSGVVMVSSETFARKWADKTGTFSVEAEFVSLADGFVTLKREDGRTVRLALDKLSATDQEVARAVAQAINAAPKTPANNSPSKDQDPFVPGIVKPAKTETAEAAPDDKNTRTILVEGVGTTPEEALKDAFRNAVRQVVGEVVDAETLVKNDELVKDQVLTYSDAFVPKHKKVSEKREGGLFRTTIQATVERRSLIQKLTTAKIVVKALDGQSMFGNIVSQLDADKSAGALIRKALDGFPGNCIETKVVGEPKLLHKDEEKATLQVNVQFQAHREAYRAFAARLEKTLAAVAADKGEFSCSFKPTPSVWASGAYMEFNPVDNFDVTKLMPKAVVKVETAGPGIKWSANKFTVALATQADPTLERLTFSYFNLAVELREPFLDAALQQAKCKLSLLDSEAGTVASDLLPDEDPRDRWDRTLLIGFGGDPNGADPDSFSTSLHTCRKDHLLKEYWYSRWMVIAPVFFDQQSPTMIHRPTLTASREISVPLGDIKRLKEVRCELSFEKQSIPADR